MRCEIPKSYNHKNQINHSSDNKRSEMYDIRCKMYDV